ncbi:MAG: outer membrane beta-barrel protein [Bacteroidota bacterium]|nr:outer membrane beta-barrel protein [Bacteroidota bacterium]MDP4231013.1 outer membrane beta-barrel protein [Bacteroidota bacterium]MDP4237138.1 outer membrane beta-barrel protein [Bacteroidota bacterium]
MRNIVITMVSFSFMVVQSLFAQSPSSSAPDTTAVQSSEPFAWGDFTWINGNDRRHTALLDSKYVTGRVLLDANYTASNQHPVDHTVIGSTSLARDNEFAINVAALGGDFHYDNARASILLQIGTRSTVVPRNDYSAYHGQYDLFDAYRFLSEANAGYHFDVLHGINVDAGMFMSYIGLFSYYNAENWTYQPSFTSDNTPWFFNGMRIQIFPSDRLKLELWIVNGWQSYAKFNNAPGIGVQLTWRPVESIQVLSNNYYGYDAAMIPDRMRFHTDNSFLLRYYSNPGSSGITKMAFSLTQDIGFERGGGVSGFGKDEGPQQYFISGMLYNRIWLLNDHLGTTIGAGYINNPGRYLVLYPTGDASNLPNPYNPTTGAGTHPFSANPGDQFHGWDATISLDWMPNDYVQYDFQIIHREADVPYFAGPGGVTSPTGYTTSPIPSGWTPDLVKNETRFVGALLVRF